MPPRTHPFRGVLNRKVTVLAATAAIAFSNPIVARAEDNGGFHELETKYIFGFTIGSSVRDQGDKEFEPDIPECADWNPA